MSSEDNIAKLAKDMGAVITRRRYLEYKPPPQRRIVEVTIKRQRKFFGIPIVEYTPLHKLPDGWSIGWHTWNKGITLSYVPPPRQKVDALIKVAGDDETPAGEYEVRKVEVHPSFWQRKLPRGWSFTLAKLCGQWTFTRSATPFLEASLNINTVSVEQWQELMNTDGPKIYGKDEPIPETDLNGRLK